MLKTLPGLRRLLEKELCLLLTAVDLHKGNFLRSLRLTTEDDLIEFFHNPDPIQLFHLKEEDLAQYSLCDPRWAQTLESTKI